MKLCKKCNKRRRDTSFNRRGRGLQPWCRFCMSTYNRNLFKTSEYRRDSVIKRRNEVRNLCHQIRRDTKNVPCLDCGKKYPSYVMEFDHVRGEKVKAVSAIMVVKKLMQEIAKCEVVCANCHRERTFIRRSSNDKKAASDSANEGLIPSL